jgi:biotin operon repressor
MDVESENPLARMSLGERIGLLKALADPVRASVVCALGEKPHCAEELAERLRRPPSTISFHLKKLEQAGVVTSSRAQYYAVYQLRGSLLEARLLDVVRAPGVPQGQQRLDKYRDKVLATFLREGVLVQMPKQWRKRRVILDAFLALFEPGRSFDESEVNRRITTMYEDYCTIRRMLVDEGLMTRQGRTYVRPAQENEEMESRSELKRKYKEDPKQAGIFLITCQANGKVYLGSSLNLHGSLNKHRFLLDYGNHWTRGLQQDWARHGAASFTFETVELIKPGTDPEFDIESELCKREKAWLLKTQGNRYNKEDIRE